MPNTSFDGETDEKYRVGRALILFIFDLTYSRPLIMLKFFPRWRFLFSLSEWLRIQDPSLIYFTWRKLQRNEIPMEMKLLNVKAISRYNRSLINSPTMFVARRRDIKISTPCWKRVQSRSYGAMGLLKMMLKERIMEMSRHTNVGFPYYRRLSPFALKL